MPARTTGFFLALVAVLALLSARTAAAEETAVTKGPYDYARVTLLQLQNNPTAYRNQYVTFECKFARTGNVYKEVQTGLLPELHQNFFAWDPSVRLWIPDERKDLVCLTLYMLKASISWKHFVSLEPLERIIVWGQVRSDLGGEPWIEVRQIDRAPGPNIDRNFVSTVYLGWTLLKDKRYGEALPNFLKALSRNLPRMEEGAVCAYAGECYYNLGNYKLAVRFYDRAVELDPSNLDLMKALVRSYYRARNYEKAERVALKALEKDPNLHEVRVVLALIKGKRGKVDEGLRDVEYVLLRDSSNIEALKARAELFLLKNDYERAIKAIEKAIFIQSRNVELQYERAWLYERMGDLAKAKEGYKVALSLDPDYAPALIALARIAIREGDTETARAYLAKVSAGDVPADRLVEIGGFYESTGDMDRALEYYERAVAKDPNFVDARIAAARILLARGELKKAAEYFRAALSAAPDDREALFGLCRAILWQGRRSRKALDLARRLYTEFSKDPAAAALLGYALLLDGKADKAAPLLDEALAARPDDPEFAMYKGEALYRAANYAEAVPLLEKAAAAGAPYSARAAELLGRAKAEVERENARLRKLEEKRRRAEEKKRLAAERKRLAAERRKKAAERRKLEREKRAAELAARKKEIPSAPRRPLASVRRTKGGKKRPLFAVRKVEKPKPPKPLRIVRAKPAEPAPEPAGAPRSWLKKYGYKPYRVPRSRIKALVGPSPERVSGLPDPAKVKERIFADFYRRLAEPRFEDYYTPEKVRAAAAKLDKDIARIRYEVEKSRAKEMANIEYQRAKALDKILAEHAWRMHRREYERRFYDRRIEKAVARVRRRYDRTHEDMRKMGAMLEKQAAERLATDEKLRDEAKRYAAAYMEVRNKEFARIKAKAETMRRNVLSDVRKAEEELARLDARTLAASDDHLAEIRSDMARRRAALAAAERRRREREQRDHAQRMKELEKIRKEAAEAGKDVISVYYPDERAEKAFRERLAKLQREREKTRKEAELRLKRMQKQAVEAQKDYQEYLARMDKYRAKKAHEFEQALRDRLAAEVRSDRFVERRISKAERKRMERWRRFKEEMEKLRKKADEEAARRLEELRRQRELAKREAEKMIRKAAELREKLRKQVEKETKEAMKRRYD